MILKTYKVSGNEKIGYRLVIPSQVYKMFNKPKRYTCEVAEDGALMYKPVKDAPKEKKELQG
jgi:16S rRNA U516 pseudouridylate synthase RsuA-like enzyme